MTGAAADSLQPLSFRLEAPDFTSCQRSMTLQSHAISGFSPDKPELSALHCFHDALCFSSSEKSPVHIYAQSTRHTSHGFAALPYSGAEQSDVPESGHAEIAATLKSEKAVAGCKTCFSA